MFIINLSQDHISNTSIVDLVFFFHGVCQVLKLECQIYKRGYLCWWWWFLCFGLENWDKTNKIGFWCASVLFSFRLPGRGNGDNTTDSVCPLFHKRPGLGAIVYPHGSTCAGYCLLEKAGRNQHCVSRSLKRAKNSMCPNGLLCNARDRNERQ